MKEIVASGKFKKDLKRYRHKLETLEKLYEVVGILERGKVFQNTTKRIC